MSSMFKKFSTHWALLPVSTTPWQQAYTRAETTYDDMQYRWTSYQGRSFPHWLYPSLNCISRWLWTSTRRTFVSTVRQWEYVQWLSHRGPWDNLCSNSGRSPSLTWYKFALPAGENNCCHWMKLWLRACSLFDWLIWTNRLCEFMNQRTCRLSTPVDPNR